MALFEPHWKSRVPKRVKMLDISQMSDSIRSQVKNYFSVQIRSLWGLFLDKWAIFYSF